MRNIKCYLPFLAAFLIPVLLMLVVYMVCGIIPFGDNTVVTGDLKNQYLAIENYLHANFWNWRKLLYSTSVGLGIDFYPVLTYYVFSPLNLLALFFSRSSMSIYFELNILISIGLSGLFSYLYLTKASFTNRPQPMKPYVAIVGAVMFSMSSYMVLYSQCVMWLDVIMLLPLIMLGLDHLLFMKSKGWLYYLTLTLAIFSNYYMGIMILMYLFFLTLLLVGVYFRQFRQKISEYVHLFLLTVAAILSTAFVTIPSYMAQREVSQAHFTLQWGEVFPVWGFIKSFTSQPELGIKAPILYTSIGIVFLIGLYLIDDQFSVKERIGAIVLIIYLLFSSIEQPLYMMWHMFTMPNGFPQRQSYLIVFTLIILAAKELNNYQRDWKKTLIIAITFELLLTCILISRLDNNDWQWFALNTIIIVGWTATLAGIKTNYVNGVVLGMVCLEALISDIGIERQFDFAKNQPYQEYTVAYEQALRQVKHDKTFYRVGSNSEINMNDPMNFNYNGVSGYVSQFPTADTDLISSFGYFQKHTWFRWAEFNGGSTQGVNGILGFKYYLDFSKGLNQVVNEYRNDKSKSNPKVAQLFESKVDSYPGVRVYRDELVMPPLIKVNKHNAITMYSTESNPFPFYNDAFRAVDNQQLYSDEAPITVGNGKSNHRYIPSKSGELYAYFATPMSEVANEVMVKANGHNYDLFGSNAGMENGVTHLGRVRAGKPLTIQIYNHGQPMRVYIAIENSELLNSIVKRQDRIYQRCFKDVSFNGSKISFDTTDQFDGGTLMLPIIFSANWHINGGEGITPVFSNLLGVTLKRGVHHVTLDYAVPFLKKSIAISSLGVVFGLVTCSLGNSVVKTKRY